MGDNGARRSQSSAAGAALGYYFQSRYALYALLRSEPNSRMALECLDDIEFREDGSPSELLQAKHSVKEEAWLTNSSPDLWRTIQHWIDVSFSDEGNPAEYQLCLISTADAPEQSITACLRPQGTSRNIGDALDMMNDVAKSSGSTENAEAYEAFLDLKPEQRRALLENIRVIDGESQVDDLDSLLEKELRKSVRPEHTRQLLEQLEGWWHSRVIEHLMAPDPAPITETELVYKINDLSEQFTSESLPINYRDLNPPPEKDLDPDERVFISQLRLIDVHQKRIQKAIADYYRAYTQRSRWAREDLLNPNELDDYEERLVDEWERYFLAMKGQMDDDPDEGEKVEQGKTLYGKIELEEGIRIRPKVAEPYVYRGSYHILSNDCRVGWHPDFKERLDELIAKAEERVT